LISKLEAAERSPQIGQKARGEEKERQKEEEEQHDVIWRPNMLNNSYPNLRRPD